MIYIEDDIHCDRIAWFDTYDEAFAELHRLAAIPWDEYPNRAPCTNWRTCGREYVLVEYAADEDIVNNLPALNISAEKVEWLIEPWRAPAFYPPRPTTSPPPTCPADQ